jgi:VWFA-related protein
MSLQTPFPVPRAVFFTLLLIVFSSSPGALAQKTENGTHPTLRTETTLVEVPVIVSDKQGHQVADLRKEDFLVKEDGRRQEIAVFEHLRHVAAPSIALPVPEGVFTNRVQQTGPARLTIIAIDAVSTAITEQQDIRKQLLNFISRNVSVDQPVALVMLAENRIKVLHDFTTDPRVLVAALKNISSAHSAATSLASDDAVIQSIPNSLNSGMQNMFNQMVAAETDTIQTAFQSFTVGQRRTMVQNSLEAFNEIAHAFVGIPGRKSLIWITNGASISTGDLDIAATFDRGQTVLGSTGLPNPIVPRTHDSPVSMADAGPRTEEYFQKTWELLNSSNIAVYPLDISDASDPGFTNPALRVRSALRRPINNLDKLEQFAESTGGSLCLRTSDLDDCFKRASEDSQDYYMLGYYPASSDKKTEWRRIQVSCIRKEVIIRARSGYFPQRAAHHEGKDAAAPVLQAIGSPLEYTSLPLEVKLESTGPAPGDSSKRRVGFTFFVPPTADFISSVDGSMSLTFAALAKLPNATPTAQFLREASGKLKPEAAADLTIHGFALPGFVDLMPGEYALRCVVRNNLNGHIGSVTLPLKVPDGSGTRHK